MNYSISDAATLLGITKYTLRYYEKENIVVPMRHPNGTRVYLENHIQWLRFVIKLRETRMSIADIKLYKKLFDAGDTTLTQRLTLLENHHKNIQSQLANLEMTHELLKKKIHHYRSSILR